MKTHTQQVDSVNQIEPDSGSVGPRFLTALGGHGRVAVLTAVSLTVGWGLVAGLCTPRGPLTTSTAIWSIVISAVVGCLAGLVLWSRWAMVLSAVVFVAVFELTRLGVDGPMVDGIHPSFYGTIALITGRGFHGLLALVPMALGAALGAGVARARARDEQQGVSRHWARVLRRSPAPTANASPGRWRSSPLSGWVAMTWG